ncbi:Na+/H+ antiporter [Beijerinckiaceae bacterium RH AL1]|nr:cation:proton antiporter [Beijerinckiaceae bacterium]VVB48481.1 Na+/H+ antiporter [Beijerinckiaceae bacterium RH CH11]VVB48562.1 Na+/H+ antiporter [Beijerinckiaceae bacterium RH AL8]VVC56416.1 Na+/H+ antiporter [Beijerinckiaceae bacterium RH AL1]
MLLLEWLVPLLIGAVALTRLADRIGVPYPAFLALGGAVLALLPQGPNIVMEPDLALALFVAPVIVDTAYDASLRDMRTNWLSISLLVVAAVGVTTAAVAIAARAMLPDLPWSAAIALGAIVAPPDATAATAILRQVHLPFRLSTILGGESLLNDASALFVYRLAVGAFAAGGISPGYLATSFVLVLPASLLAGWLTARATTNLMGQIDEIGPAVIMQFSLTFGIWMLAEELQLSAVLVLVAYAATVANNGPRRFRARLRLPTFSVWEVVIFVLNVLAFVLIGLQLRPILEAMSGQRLAFALSFAFAILLVCILARLAWVAFYGTIRARPLGRIGRLPQGVKDGRSFARGGVVIGWCGMRGIVTLAAAFALPENVPHRDLMLLTAFVVVLGTLTIQGMTLKPLVQWAGLEDDDPVGREIGRARTEINRAALSAIESEKGAAADGLRAEYAEILRLAEDHPDGFAPPQTSQDALRLRSIEAARSRLHEMRASGDIGNDAFSRLEFELDRAELHASAV